MKKTFLILATIFIFAGIIYGGPNPVTANYNVIPLPVKVATPANGSFFNLNSKTVITYPKSQSDLKKEAEHLQSYIYQITGLKLAISQNAESKNAINLSVKEVINNPEGYRINVDPEKIDIEGTTSAGVFYGIQTLRKSIPAASQGAEIVEFPVATINDYPRFGYRGAHLDVARHYFPKDSVKKFIDLMALHNINSLHWHLTDDQGWRVEIKKYPKLTEIGSKRLGTVIGRNTNEYDEIPVEGYFTQEEIKEIVDYAANRHITIIPEIDLPGHMVAALTAYPELGCTGGPYEVWKRWGVSEDLLCAGNDSVYAFIDDVLEEVSDLFPGEYFHIGGDECPKERWKECVKCQARIEELGLKNDENSNAEEKLQSYVMTHASDFLAGKGKKVIGWDEILEGGVSPETAIMSWRGETGGIKASGMGHDVIMTPNNYLYFDYYQTLDKAHEPLAMNGYVPLDKVYSYEPISPKFTPEQRDHIIGVQANLWTEYIKTFPHAIYMELPRMAALCEVQWTPGQKNYDEFMDRLPAMLDIYRANGYPYSLRAYDVIGEISVNDNDNTLAFNLKAPKGAKIYYTVDGSEPSFDSQLYKEPVKVNSNTKLRAKAKYGFGDSSEYCDSVLFNKATAHPVTLVTPPSPNFTHPASILTDGQRAGSDWKTGWIGYHGTDAEVVVDLLEPMEFSTLATNCVINTVSHVFDARKMTVSVSDDGENWTEVASEEYPELSSHVTDIRSHSLNFEPVKARFVKLEVVPEKSMPGWHAAKGKKGFLFIDEIEVN